MKVIVVFTEGGRTARLISKYRPGPPIIAFSRSQDARREMSLLWGVVPRRSEEVHDLEEMSAVTERRLIEEGLVRTGDLVGIVGGTPLGVGGTTNFMKFHVVGGGEQVRR